jgi:hypothetical protein
MENFSSTLKEIGLAVSTGPVVDFRLKSSLRNSLDSFNVPLIYTEHGHKLRILKIRDNIVKIEKVVKRLRND